MEARIDACRRWPIKTGLKEIPVNSVVLRVHRIRCVACMETHEGRIPEEFTFQNNLHGHEYEQIHTILKLQKTRLIAEVKIKTDKLDAPILKP